MKILPIKYANSSFREDCVFMGGSDKSYIPIDFMLYVIKTENRLILADAGCEKLSGFDMQSFILPTEALEQKGVRPSDITDVFITHSHYDHIECVKYFQNANIYIQSSEYEDGKAYFSSDMRITVFDDEIEICRGVRAVKTGGHSRGSSVMEIDGGEKIYVITGDECYCAKNVYEKKPQGYPYSLENNVKFLSKYSDGKYVLLLCHESPNATILKKDDIIVDGF